MLLAQDPDVRADHGRLVPRYLIDAAEPSGHHAPACQMTLYDLNDPGRLTYRFAASIASALQVTRTDTCVLAGQVGGWQDVAPAVLAGLDFAAEDPGELDVLG